MMPIPRSSWLAAVSVSTRSRPSGMDGDSPRSSRSAITSWMSLRGSYARSERLCGPGLRGSYWCRGTSAPLQASDALVDVDVSVTGGFGHLGRHLRARGRLVPSGRQRPIAYELFVVGMLRAAGLPLVSGPEAG